jgi:hypothetical protein
MLIGNVSDVPVCRRVCRIHDSFITIINIDANIRNEVKWSEVV